MTKWYNLGRYMGICVAIWFIVSVFWAWEEVTSITPAYNVGYVAPWSFYTLGVLFYTWGLFFMFWALPAGAVLVLAVGELIEKIRGPQDEL